MADINLTQAEADALIAMEKYRLDDTRWDYPGLGGLISIPLVSKDKRENFLLDMSRGENRPFKRNLSKPFSAGNCACPFRFWRSTASKPRRTRDTIASLTYVP